MTELKRTKEMKELLEKHGITYEAIERALREFHKNHSYNKNVAIYYLFEALRLIQLETLGKFKTRSDTHRIYSVKAKEMLAGYDTIVGCQKCGRVQHLDFINGLKNGWSECCGQTMPIIKCVADIEQIIKTLLKVEVKKK